MMCFGLQQPHPMRRPCSDFYSAELNRAVDLCLHEDPYRRPTALFLAKEARK